MKSLLLLAAALALTSVLPATATATDGWCYGPLCLATCTAGETVCLDPEACRAGEAGGCVDVDRNCLHGDPCGPPS